jgi:hypothetical protein
VKERAKVKAKEAEAEVEETCEISMRDAVFRSEEMSKEAEERERGEKGEITALFLRNGIWRRGLHLHVTAPAYNV